MSTIKVNTVENRTGSTLTLGKSGTTIQLACGATQTGFGRTGTVDWQTSIKTAASFTAVNGQGFFVDTSSNAVTANLPAGSAGAIVSFKDYAQNFGTNALTISADGSEKIEGQTFDLVLETNGLGVTLVYGDATKGWQAVNSNEISNIQKYVTATGGNTVITSGDFKTHVFTGDGTFCVSCGGNASGSTTIDYVVVAGGGGGGGDGGGGGGAGGFRLSNGYSIPAPTMSPLASGTSITAAVQAYPITVGGGGTAGKYQPAPSTSGGDGAASVFSTITSTGGGGGGDGGSNPSVSGRTGGSGGGGTRAGSGGAGNTPPVSPPQGNPGSPNGPNPNGDGGGGAGAAGNQTPGNPQGGPGGIGSFVADPFFGPTAPSYGGPGPVSNVRYFAGGGGGGGDYSPSSTGGTGGSGGGATGGSRPSPSAAASGTTNTGGGGGGGGVPGNAGAGGSGVVLIRYKFQN